MSYEAIFALGSVIVALIAAGFVAWDRITARPVERLTLQVEYFNGLRAWADSCCDVLTEACHLSYLDPTRCDGESFFVQRQRILVALSSLIDRGRWYFPNYKVEYGQHKEAAYRGHRHEILDSLVAAYKSVRQLNYTERGENAAICKKILQGKRIFIGNVQDVLAPNDQKDEFLKIMKKKKNGEGKG
ncbi:hypothetical protein [Azospirillum sp. B506]|uniref:hypothetical protein n=1 Tax=Azospirillum sp. B506 TaxID=137721 RepID=UPI0006789A23|nr:hypothetical protein [Azospirillum sp. B506]